MNGDEKVTTYDEFRSLLLSFQKAILVKNIPSGNLAILVAANSPKWPAAYFGAHMCGLTVAHGDVQFTKDEFRNIERFTNPALILCERSFSHFFRKETQKIHLEDINPSPFNEEPEIVPLTENSFIVASRTLLIPLNSTT